MSDQSSRLIECPPFTRYDAAAAHDNRIYHRFALVDGVRLHYLTTEADIGSTQQSADKTLPWLLLLAGFPESSHSWRHVIPLLRSHYRIIAVDFPGQGESDKPADGYDTAALADKVHSLVQQLHIGRYHIAAHDVGAWVAYPYARRYSSEVHRLALLDAGIPGVTLPDALPTAPDRVWRTWHFAFHCVDELPEQLLTGRERIYLDWFLRRKVADPACFTDADIDEYVRHIATPGGLRAGLAYYRAAHVSAAQNRELVAAGKLTVPVLAVSADQGSIPDMAVGLRQFCENVTGIRLQHCGHFVSEEQPKALADHLHAFFSQPE